VESLDHKRVRLRKALQLAYGDWLAGSEGATGAFSTTVLPGAGKLDTSGCPDSSKALWFAYQQARIRLVEAYAERDGDASVVPEGPPHRAP